MGNGCSKDDTMAPPATAGADAAQPAQRQQPQADAPAQDAAAQPQQQAPAPKQEEQAAKSAEAPAAAAAPASVLKIYGMGGSSCTQRVLITAFENDAPFEIQTVDLRKGEHKQPAHLARQPFGQIPALVDDDLTIYESRAVARYVNDSRGGKLTPSDPKKRAIMEQWLSLEAGTITPEVSGIVMQRIFAPMFGGQTDEAAVAAHVEKATQGLDIMDAHLAKNEYLAGDQFTLADAFFMPYFAMVLTTAHATLLTSRPNINAWWKRVTARPSWFKAQQLSEFAAHRVAADPLVEGGSAAAAAAQ